MLKGSRKYVIAVFMMKCITIIMMIIMMIIKVNYTIMTMGSMKTTICRLLRIEYDKDGKIIIRELHSIIRSRPFSINEVIFIKIKDGVISIV